MMTGGLASPPESRMNSPNVPSVPTFLTASEFLAGQFSPSCSTALDFQLADFQKCNRDEFIHEKSPLQMGLSMGSHRLKIIGISLSMGSRCLKIVLTRKFF